MVKYYHSKKPWQSSCKNSLGVILQIMFSYYKIMKCMDIICITTSVIYTFNTHGKYSNLRTHHLRYDAIIRNHEHYLQNGIHHSKCYLRKWYNCLLNPISANLGFEFEDCANHCKFPRMMDHTHTNEITLGLFFPRF